MVIQPDIEPVFGQIGRILRHELGVVMLALAGQQPSGMRPPGAFVGRMRVAGQIGVLMMHAVRGHPGNGPALER